MRFFKKWMTKKKEELVFSERTRIINEIKYFQVNFYIVLDKHHESLDEEAFEDFGRVYSSLSELKKKIEG